MHDVIPLLCHYITHYVASDCSFKIAERVHYRVAQTVLTFLNVKPRESGPKLPYNVAVQWLPLLSLTLRRLAVTPGCKRAFKSTLGLLAHIFHKDRDGVQFEDLASEQYNILPLVLEQLDVGSQVREPVLRIMGQLSMLDDYDILLRVFIPPVLAQLQQLSSSPLFTALDEFAELMVILSNLLTKSVVMVQRVFSSNVLQTFIPRVPVPRRTDSIWSSKWRAASLLHRLVRTGLAHARKADGGTLTVALMFLNAGVLQHCAQTLYAAATMPEPPHYDWTNRLLQVVRLMIETGDTGEDREVIEQGTRPRNVFLAAFFAAGGRDALLELSESDCICAETNESAM